MLYVCSTGLRRKQLIISFGDQFKLNLETTRCIDFQFHNPNASQEGCLEAFVY